MLAKTLYQLGEGGSPPQIKMEKNCWAPRNAIGLALLLPQVEPGDALPLGGLFAAAAPTGGGGLAGVVNWT